MNSYFDYAIGLGPACRTGYQIRRVFGRGCCLPSIFDRQLTPLPTITHAFECNFERMFELEDFTDAPVRHRRFGFSKIHGFGDDLQNYPAMRVENDKVCAIMRDALSSRRRILFVIETTSQPALEGIADVISARRCGAPFHIVSVKDDMPADSWKGNNHVWSDALAGLDVRGTIYSHAVSYRRRLEKHLLGKYRA